MQNAIRFLLLFALALRVGAVTVPKQVPTPSEAGLNYSYLRSNAPPGSCGCFALEGSNGWIAFKVAHRVTLVGEFGVQHGSNILGSAKDLTLVSYTAGPRYTWYKHGRFTTYGQALFGGAHASGSLSPNAAGLFGSNSFAMTLGAGLDVGLKKRFSVRALQADYFLTHFANATNDHQNNLRLSFGVVYSWGTKAF